MPLAPGSKLGPYEIVAPIGAGGMGEVYRARDTRLSREVAIKVSAEQFTERFEREARAIAALNHPNICHVYDVGPNYLVMELVEGSTLAERIKSGAIPLAETLAIARQIADALEAAHEKGIVHRDLKPANIKIKPDGAVKVLDFGLAKTAESAAPGSNPENSPTLTLQDATRAGVILGTAGYMSPEQTRGKPVDKRADIWAFGVVLSEMLTGKRLFRGEDLTETLASIVKEQPNLDGAPFEVRRLLRKCLEKDPKKRLRDIGDVWELLEEERAPAVSSRNRIWPIAAGACLLLAMAGWFAFLYLRPKPGSAPVQRFTINPQDANLGLGVLSPDGTMLLFGSTGRGGQLWLRRLDSLEAHPLASTEGARGVPFWSPDSRFIAFGNGSGKLIKVDLAGGPAQVLCDAGAVVIGGFWTADGRIVFGDPSRPPGLFAVSAAGGTAAPLTGMSQVQRAFPVLLSDGKHFLYLQQAGAAADVYVGSLDDKGKNNKKLLTGVGQASLAVVPQQGNTDLDYLLFPRQFSTRGSATAGSGTLMAQPFDLRKLELTGEAIPIAEQVGTSFSASRTDILVYRSGGALTTRQLTILDRQGKIRETVGEPGDYVSEMVFSPDARRLVVSRRDSGSGNENLWIFDLARGIGSRFSSGAGRDVFPAWSPDGSRIAFASYRGGQYLTFQKFSNGGGEEELLLKMDAGELPLSWSGDGRFLFVGNASPEDALTSVLPLTGNFQAGGKPYVFVKKGLGIDERFSPGPQGHPRWVAYQSNESGRFEVYIRPFDPNSPTGVPAGSGVWQVSTAGGVSPRWSGNGKELFYMALDGRSGTVLSVDVSGETEFRSSAPKPLFKPQGWISDRDDAAYWDVTPDGKQFLFAIPQASTASASPSFTVVLKWMSLLKK